MTDTKTESIGASLAVLGLIPVAMLEETWVLVKLVSWFMPSLVLGFWQVMGIALLVTFLFTKSKGSSPTTVLKSPDDRARQLDHLPREPGS